MDYKEKYNGALERARMGLHDCNLLPCDDMTRKAAITTIYNLFPELADDDERIRKGIIRNLQYLMDRSEGFVKEDLQERIAWLEKQGEQKPTLPKWKYKKDHTPLLRDSLILNKYGCVAKSPSGAIVSDVWVLDYDELAKLPKEEFEKQGETFTKKDVDDAYLQGICDAKNEIEKRSEQPPADKIEPKPKVGDWVVINETTYQITKIDNSHVVLSLNGRESNFRLNVLNLNNAHLWTINDAKDGDILVMSKDCSPFIFKRFDQLHPDCPVAYGGIDDDDEFIPSNGSGWWDDGEIRPATKEQRDLLFAKMHDAGYEWDAEKKELENIEPKTLNADEMIEWLKKFSSNHYIMDYEDCYEITEKELIEDFNRAMKGEP